MGLVGWLVGWLVGGNNNDDDDKEESCWLLCLLYVCSVLNVTALTGFYLKVIILCVL